MSWRHLIATVVLAVLASMPIAAATCAIACAPTSSAPLAHHGSGPACDAAARQPSGNHIASPFEHDCGTHDAGIAPASTAASNRVDLAAGWTRVSVTTSADAFETVHAAHVLAADGLPPGTAPPTTTPLVLRV